VDVVSIVFKPNDSEKNLRIHYFMFLHLRMLGLHFTYVTLNLPYVYTYVFTLCYVTCLIL